MGSSSPTQERTERLQSLTFLGLLADDVCLATIHYPSLSEREQKALESLKRVLAGEPSAHAIVPRPKSMSDPFELFEQAIAIAHGEDPGQAASPDFRTLTALVDEILQGTADSDALEKLQHFVEMIGQVTLALTERLATEKGIDAWTPKALTFSAA